MSRNAHVTVQILPFLALPSASQIISIAAAGFVSTTVVFSPLVYPDAYIYTYRYTRTDSTRRATETVVTLRESAGMAAAIESPSPYAAGPFTYARDIIPPVRAFRVKFKWPDRIRRRRLLFTRNDRRDDDEIIQLSVPDANLIYMYTRERERFASFHLTAAFGRFPL